MLTKSTLRFCWVFAIFAMLTACGGPVQRVDLKTNDRSGEPQQVTPQALVVNLTGALGTPELARCHRSIREAAALKCKYVIFRLDAAGTMEDDLSGLQSLLDRMQSSEVGTVAVLSRQVSFGAAMLALCTDQTFCLSGTSWGQINKPEQELFELLESDPEGAMARRIAAESEQLRLRLQKRKTPLTTDGVMLAMAMIDPRMQLVSATVRQGGLERLRVMDQKDLQKLQDSGATVIGEQRLTRPLTLSSQEAEEFQLSGGTLSGFDQLGDILLIDRDAIGELTVNWAEKMVGWLALLQPFLLVAGFLMLLIEVKAPGTVLPGILGVVFLALALFHSYLVGLAAVTEIIVFFLGLAAIGVEIFLLPGTIVFGLVGFLCLLLSLILSQQSFVLPSNSVEEGILLTNLINLLLLFVLVLVLGALIRRLLPNVPVFNRLMLVPPGRDSEPASNSEASGLGIENDALVKLVGRTGRAVTVMRPTGTMDIDGQRFDVVTEGEFIDNGSAVRVLYVQGNRVVVAADTPANDPRAGERGSAGIVVMLCVIGLALIFVEVIFVTMGVVGILSATSLIAAIFVAFQESMTFGYVMLVIEAIAAPVTLWLSFKALPHTPFGKRMILTGPPTDGSNAAADEGLNAYVGKSGVTLSPLRPAGYARIDGKKVDVVTRGEMLPKDCNVVVLEVSGNRVVVADAQNAPAGVRN